jgi:hypothetical protein
MNIVDTVKEIPAKKFPSGSIYNLAEVIDYAVIDKKKT